MRLQGYRFLSTFGPAWNRRFLMSLDRPRTSREISDKKKKAPESGAFWYKILDKNIRRGRGRCDFVDTIPVLREETKINGNRAGPPSPERMVPNNESKPEHYLRLKIPTAFLSYLYFRATRICRDRTATLRSGLFHAQSRSVPLPLSS